MFSIGSSLIRAAARYCGGLRITQEPAPQNTTPIAISEKPRTRFLLVVMATFNFFDPTRSGPFSRFALKRNKGIKAWV